MAEQKKIGTVGVESAFRIINTVIEKFGWPGTLLLLFFWFVNEYSTLEQKQRIIELYVLGKGISNIWPILVLSGIFVITVFAQHRWYKMKLSVFDKEIKREGSEKSRMQEAAVGRKLRHVGSSGQNNSEKGGE